MNSLRLSSVSLFCSLIILFCLSANAQVSINYNNALPDSSAMLDVDVNDKGVLIPRLTNNQRDSISNPATGLLIYNTTSNCFNVYKLGLWFEMCGNCIAPPNPVLSTNGPVCAGDTLRISTALIQGASYSWTGPNGFTSSQQNVVIPNASASDSGNYSLVVSYPGCNSNPVSILAAVNSNINSNFTASSNPASIGQSVSFTPSTSGGTYAWSFQSGTPSSSTSANPSVTWSATGTYEVVLQVSKNGCTAIPDTVQVSVINCPPGSQTFTYTGNVQTFTVPPCATSITIDAYGAQGGGTGGGLGGRAQATIPVTPGETLNIYVGGRPTSRQGGGWNGGGSLPAVPCGGGTSDGYGGGGGSDVRRGTALSGRLVIAGGGGGMGWSSQPGGGGGGLNGQTPVGGWVNSSTNGGGGSQFSGGGRGQYTSGVNDAGAGSLGQGGTGGPTGGYCSGGGGGGGYWGGGGGHVSAGGGGSSFIGAPGSTNTSTSTGVRSGDGQITITW